MSATRVERPAEGPFDWLMKRLGFEAWVSIDTDAAGEEIENFNLRVPRWVARRPRLLDRLAAEGTKIVREIEADEREPVVNVAMEQANRGDANDE